MARMIDADRLLRELTALSHGQVWPGWTYDGIRLLIERQPTLTPPNEPLTLEQLREMEDPVWCVCKTVEGFEGFWCLCDHGYILTPARQIFDVKEIPHWVFYRRPPEGEEDT